MPQQEALSFLRSALPRLLAMAESSRRKDFERGKKIFDDYEAVHGTLEDDEFIQVTRRRIAEELAALDRF